MIRIGPVEFATGSHIPLAATAATVVLYPLACRYAASGLGSESRTKLAKYPVESWIDARSFASRSVVRVP